MSFLSVFVFSCTFPFLHSSHSFNCHLGHFVSVSLHWQYFFFHSPLFPKCSRKKKGSDLCRLFSSSQFCLDKILLIFLTQYPVFQMLTPQICSRKEVLYKAAARMPFFSSNNDKPSSWPWITTGPEVSKTQYISNKPRDSMSFAVPPLLDRVFISLVQIYILFCDRVK